VRPRLGLLGAHSALFAGCAAGLLAGCGGGGSTTGASSGARAASSRRETAGAITRVSVAQTGTLPLALQDAAVAASGQGGFLLMGGLDEGEASHDEMLQGGASGASAIGTLPVALHDACAAWLGRAAYLFGGGQQSSFAGVYRVEHSGAARSARSLPSSASDLGCATVGATAYLVGGYTGAEPLNTILAWRPREGARVVGRLPKPLRYAAVVATGRGLTIVGGTSGEQASSGVYRFDPRSGSVRKLASLPGPLTHAAAAPVGDTVLVFGGRSALASGQTTAIRAIAPGGQIRLVGRLPKPLSDMAAVVVGGRVLLLGGRDGTGRVQDSILSVTPS
jgi:Kelch motif